MLLRLVHGQKPVVLRDGPESELIFPIARYDNSILPEDIKPIPPDCVYDLWKQTAFAM